MTEDNPTKKMLTHDGNGWWDLPKTHQEEKNPQGEGPIGDPWFKQAWDFVTYAGVSHASVRGYLFIAVILSIITFFEWRLFEVDAFGASGLNAIMLVLSTVKFTLVVAFFMHLRFEHRYYSWMFAAAMVLGVAVFLAVLLLQRHHGVG